MNVQLFEGECIHLAPIDPEKDVETISKWTHDPEYLRLTDAEGRLQQPIRRGSRFWDEIVMGALRDDGLRANL